ncbi:MAG: hypothetical protein ACOYMA_12200 [Bacteroidia bacterium]
MAQVAIKNIQDQFINKIKAVIPTNENLVQSISDVLNLSVDSTYRRIRGEKLFNIEEVAILCKTFKIKFDEEVELFSNKATFDFTLLEHNKANFKNWLSNILGNLKAISSRPENTILYSADDVPIWHHFNDDLLIQFKLFYWLKTILGDADFVNKNFDPNLIEPEMVQMAKDISYYYNQTTSVEIWTEDSFNSTLKQIEYFWESGFFKDKTEALNICNSIKNEIDILMKMCMNSSKLLSGKQNFTMYQSEVMVGNNSIVANIGDTKISYVSYNTFNMMTTTNSLFVNEAEEWLKNLIKKSILISGVGEKQRNQYFKKLTQKLENTRSKIELS